MTEKEIDDKILELFKYHNNITSCTENVLIHSSLLALSGSLALIGFNTLFNDSSSDIVMYGMLGTGNAALSVFELKKVAKYLKFRKESIDKFDEVLKQLDDETGRLR